MSSTTAPLTAMQGPGCREAARIARRVAGVLAFWRAWRNRCRARRARLEMARLGDRQLRDIGLARVDLLAPGGPSRLARRHG
jgi:uncharacterized protein YjiS (DUF1127 family)